MKRASLRAWCLALAFVLGSAIGQGASARSVDEVDLSGYWEPLDMEDFQTTYLGPDPVDYTGLPINDAGRARALGWSDGQLAMPERQCIYYGTGYLATGPFGFRISAETEEFNGRTIAWRISPWIDRQATVIWVDGRAHPGPETAHTFAGFTTGVWQGHTLTTTTTHLRESPLRRNGVQGSDRTTVTMHFTRHGDILHLTALITDPVYLSEPFVVSRLYRLNPSAYLKNDMVMPCVPRRQGSIPAGFVPSYLPGKNPFEHAFADQYGLPVEAALGGAQSLYPEYRHRLEGTYRRPESMCSNGSCCGWGDARNPEHYNRYSALACPGTKRSSPEVGDLIDPSGGAH
ncbi:hypothetical protein ACV229_27165 [Burkholderia sp. MR1-5-21]